METQENPNEQNETAGDETVEEFVEQVENDPSTAKSGNADDPLEQVRGG